MEIQKAAVQDGAKKSAEAQPKLLAATKKLVEINVGKMMSLKHEKEEVQKVTAVQSDKEWYAE